MRKLVGTGESEAVYTPSRGDCQRVAAAFLIITVTCMAASRYA